MIAYIVCTYTVLFSLECSLLQCCSLWSTVYYSAFLCEVQSTTVLFSLEYGLLQCCSLWSTVYYSAVLSRVQSTTVLFSLECSLLRCCSRRCPPHLTLPVKLMPHRCGEESTVSPNTGPSAGTKFMTPAGSPASR